MRHRERPSILHQDCLQRLLSGLLGVIARDPRGKARPLSDSSRRLQVLGRIAKPRVRITLVHAVDHPPLSKGGTEHGADCIPAARKLVRGRHDDVLGDRDIAERVEHGHLGVALALHAWEDDEEVDVAAIPRQATGMRSEQDDLYRVELAREALDDLRNPLLDIGGSHAAKSTLWPR